jgi:hypothetical protein
MSTTANNQPEIELQQKLVFSEKPILNIVAPCTIGNGIIRLSESEIRQFEELFKKAEKKISFFIPASGSGSRMFEFLYDFLEEPNESNRAQVERFLNNIQSFAFFRQIPSEKQKEIVDFQISLQEVVSFLLNKDGMGYGELPKGLIPFHILDPFILNPFQEHIIQGARLQSKNTAFHFTIQSQFRNHFNLVVEQLQGLIGEQFQVSYSEQNKESDSYAFEDDGSLVFNKDGSAMRRPAGHGALLKNLQGINKELVFVKNIDNTQHFSKSEKSQQIWNALGGLVLAIKKEFLEIRLEPSLDKLTKLNQKFDLFSETELNTIQSNQDILLLINRPIRVCGMVRNEGQPGGGPFLIEDNGIIRKQIVEKAQISSSPNQMNQMVKSTHFNPVMMVLSYQQEDGTNFNLNDFADHSKYFIVTKKFQGQNIRFMELPGLWNGAMANWVTLFVEIPNETFSPVKTVLDLLNPPHILSE